MPTPERLAYEKKYEYYKRLKKDAAAGCTVMNLERVRDEVIELLKKAKKSEESDKGFVATVQW